MKKDLVQDRFTGSLLGMAIGDALGHPMDGLCPFEIHRSFGIVDGFFESKSGEDWGRYTANTQFALLTASAISKSIGKSPKDALLSLHVSALDNALGWDADTLAAVERAKSGLPFDQCGSVSGNGGFLTKAIPIGLAAAVRGMSDDLLFKGCEIVTSFTHKGKSQALAMFVIAKIIAESARRDFGGSDSIPDPYALYQSNESLLQRVILLCREREDMDGPLLSDKLESTRRLIQADIPIENFVGKHRNGFKFMEATCFSVFCFFKNYDEFNGIKKAVAAGGATSLNASLVGGMIGAYTGTPFLPKDMYDDLEGAQVVIESAENLLNAVWPKD